MYYLLLLFNIYLFNISELRLNTELKLLCPTGFSALQEDLCTTQHKQKEERVASKESESCEHPPIVSEEDISVGYSTFQDCIPKVEGDSSATDLFPQTHKEQAQQDFSGKMQERPEESSLECQQEYLWVSKEKPVMCNSKEQARVTGVPGIYCCELFSDSLQRTPPITRARTTDKEQTIWDRIVTALCGRPACTNFLFCDLGQVPKPFWFLFSHL